MAICGLLHLLNQYEIRLSDKSIDDNCDFFCSVIWKLTKNLPLSGLVFNGAALYALIK